MLVSVFPGSTQWTVTGEEVSLRWLLNVQLKETRHSLL